MAWTCRHGAHNDGMPCMACADEAGLELVRRVKEQMENPPPPPWELRWEQHDRGVRTEVVGYGFGYACDALFPSSEHAQLAAAAPLLARTLIAIQWANGGACPECGGKRSGKGHKKDCTVREALKKAGIK